MAIVSPRTFHRLVTPLLLTRLSSSFTAVMSNYNKIMVLTDRGLKVYKENLPKLEVFSSADFFFLDSSSLDIERVASDCNVWFGSPSLTSPLLQKCQRPKWIQSTWAGVEPFVAQGMPRDYILTNMRGIFNEQIAEYAIGHLFAYELNIREHYGQQQETNWNQLRPGRLSGKTIGILGVGEIGAAVAALAKSVGMKVYGYTRSSTSCTNVDQYFHGVDSLMHNMVPQVDYLVNIMPNTPDTANLLNKDLFCQLKDGAVIVNAGRGSAIHDEDLLDALEWGKIAYAVLDVFREEPLSPASPYWKHPNVLVTSHTAAMTESIDAIPVFQANYEKWVNGDPLNYQVDFERGY